MPTTEVRPTREDIERVRQRGVAEGMLYDCPRGCHALLVQTGNYKYCNGNRVGVGGVGVSADCLECESYLFRM